MFVKGRWTQHCEIPSPLKSHWTEERVSIKEPVLFSARAWVGNLGRGRRMNFYSKGSRYQIMSQTMEESLRYGDGKDCFQDRADSNEYEQAMESLSSLISGRKRGDKSFVGGKYGKLERMQMYIKILELEPYIQDLKIIHVAGTKGKGSTCTFCEAILRNCGFRTGLFTSPHLIDVRERIRINGLDISEEKFLIYFWDCWNRLKEHESDDLPMPPLFQFLTVLAFKIFVSEQVDVAIIEVGLGGRRDSTNFIKEPIVCGIASLGMDHTEVLGDTLGEIASHKAGIFKRNVPAFTVPQLSEAMQVLVEKANQLEVPLEVAEPLSAQKFNDLNLSLLGDHQSINAGLAVSLCKSWLKATGNSENLLVDNKKEENLDENLPEAFRLGLSTARLSGRGQIVIDSISRLSMPSHNEEKLDGGGLTFFLDGAHSPESMEACAKWFSSTAEGKKQSFFSAPSDSNFDILSGAHGNSLAGSKRTKETDTIFKKILLFNCMEVRDPEVLLPRLVTTCASSGTYFSKAIFVPSISTYNKVTSSRSSIPFDSRKDLSWQINLQKVWERMIHGNDNVDISTCPTRNIYKDELPPREFLFEDGTHCRAADGYFTCSAVLSSLPLTINWLRNCVKHNQFLQIQVLVTGSLHLVGDVLKVLGK